MIRIWKMIYHTIVYRSTWFLPNFAGFFQKKPDSGSRKSDTRSRNLFVLKHIWVKVSITWNFQPNWSKNTLKSGFPENPDFRVLFAQFGWNFQVILTSTQICFNTNNFLDRVSDFLDPESSVFRKNLAKFGKNQF